MKIRKVLNNNAVVALNDNDREVVVLGKGLGFQQRAGDLIDPEKVEKIFTIADGISLDKFQAILSEIPLKYILITERIIEYAVNVFRKQLNDGIYVSLSDHINMAIERYKKGITLQNPLVWDIKRYYREEFEIGVMAVDILKHETGLDFQIDEAGFIALHFVNASTDIDMTNVMKMTKMIGEITDMVKADFNIELDEDSVGYLRFVNSIRIFAQRLISSSINESSDDELLNILREKYPEAYKSVIKISDWVKNKYSLNICSDDSLYLILGIERMVNNTKIKNSNS